MILMPFRTGMKIAVTNESGKDLMLLFYKDEDAFWEQAWMFAQIGIFTATNGGEKAR